MTDLLEELQIPGVGRGAVARSIVVTAWDGNPVSGVFVSPAGSTTARPTVVLGHDLGGDSQAERYIELASDYAIQNGWNVAILDGPFHGSRQVPALAALQGPRPPSAEEFALVRQEMGRAGHSDHMAVDWSALVDLLVQMPEVDASRLAFEAVSMSSFYGVTFVARDPRIRAAVFHVVGLRFGEEAAGAGDEIGGDHFAQAIAEIGPRPVMLLAQSEDELISHTAYLAFYDALTGPEKELVFLPGAHRTPPVGPPSGRRQADAFLQFQLG